MTAASTLADEPSTPAGRLAAAATARPLLPAMVLLALVTALRAIGTVDSDVAWQLWIGQRMLAGADLYRDIIETNPPLWFWMALPVDRAAEYASEDADITLRLHGALWQQLKTVPELERLYEVAQQMLDVQQALLAPLVGWLELEPRQPRCKRAATPAR